MDPRDDISNTFDATIMQSKPALAGTQAVRNLQQLNNSVVGGLLPGLVVQNNVLEEGGLGGVNIQGENPIWMVSPDTGLMPSTDNLPTVNANASHHGYWVDDGDILNIESDRTRVRFEFEDVAGASAGGPVLGSGQVEGNGYRQDNSPIYYRDEGGQYYQRFQPSPLVPFATNGLETMHAVRDGILGSIFVTNGTTQTIRATVAESLLGPDPGAPPTSASLGYPEYFNRPAVYLEGVANVEYVRFNVSRTGFSPFDIRPLDLGETPQPHARVVNNTIIGKDGRASFNGERPTAEPNDKIQDAVQTWQGTSHNPLDYVATGNIGASDVDMFQFKLGVGERALIDVDTTSGLDAVLQIFDSRGIPQSFGAGPKFLSDNDAAPGETLGNDPYVDFTATADGVYYAAISSVGNTSYDPLSFANRQAGRTTGSYTISIGARHLQSFVITAENGSAYNTGDTFTIFGVPDINGGSAGQTFEFIRGLGNAGLETSRSISIQVGDTLTWLERLRRQSARAGSAVDQQSRMHNSCPTVRSAMLAHSRQYALVHLVVWRV